jgi:hypothetical protein
VLRVVFDVRRLYYMTQFLPVCRVLQRHGVTCTFVSRARPGADRDVLMRAFGAAGLDITVYETHDEIHACHRAAAPDWIVFGQGYPDVKSLAPRTRTAMLYHGIGMKRDVYAPPLVNVDVRFTEGPHYTQRLRALFPKATLVEVGYAKIDPLFSPQLRRPRPEHLAARIDPAKPTVLFAPTHSPSCFGNMSDRWPWEFPEYNLIVKPHENSWASSQRDAHRRKMRIWADAPNVYVAAREEWDPIPFMEAADILVSDASSVMFEFAATGRPVVWCDFLDLPFWRRGPFRHRVRLDPSIAPYADVGAHAPRYRDLKRTIERELAEPDRHAVQRRRCTEALIGRADGRVSERIADYLMTHVGAPEAREARAGPGSR